MDLFLLSALGLAASLQSVGGGWDVLHRQNNPDSLSGFGHSKAEAGDVNDDGFGDYIIGAPFAGGVGLEPGAAYVYSGTGGLLHTFWGPHDFSNFGSAVAGAGDVNSDGHDDFFAGAPFTSSDGSAFLYSGADGALLYRFDNPDAGTVHFGKRVTGIGDFDRDGIPDVAVSSTNGDTHVYSGATGAHYRSLHHPSGTASGLSTWVGDANGDGVPDLIIDRYLVSGADNLVIQDLTIGGVGAGDLNADGTPDLLIQRPETGPGVEVWALDSRPFLTASSAGPSVSTGPDLVLTVDFPWTDANGKWLLLVSARGTGPTIVGGVSVPLTFDSVFRATLNRSHPWFITPGYGLLDADGRSSASLISGAHLASYLGRSFHVASLSLLTAPLRAIRSSKSITIVVQP